MKQLLPLVFLIYSAVGVAAQDAETSDETFEHPRIVSGETADLNEFLWLNRPLIVFADSPADPRFIQQMEYLSARLDALAERDVIVLVDTNPTADGTLRKKLRPRGFMLVLIGKDGTKYLRKPFPWDVREITRVIDKLPLRQQEIRDGLGGS
ncbi:DUF4174 domain-containing protein [Roseovarius aestuarii]|uniref:DUF4174 domain-containing protein n=1 Tax=Roseovarius aestuarii TaxID=475083 RepID=A0A1X7BSI4_9RHOB|nr:DUF4174 domain-containing protein [Roseovarius aestuarii]SMC12565.1 hypothetical protein ROA7745_02393 [Roseovarius aestuarii]